MGASGMTEAKNERSIATCFSSRTGNFTRPVFPRIAYAHFMHVAVLVAQVVDGKVLVQREQLMSQMSMEPGDILRFIHTHPIKARAPFLEFGQLENVLF